MSAGDDDDVKVESFRLCCCAAVSVRDVVVYGPNQPNIEA